VFVLALIVLGAIVCAGFFMLGRSGEAAAPSEPEPSTETAPAPERPRYEGPARLVLAPRWKRLVAQLIDGILITIVLNIVGFFALIGTVRDVQRNGLPLLDGAHHIGALLAIASVVIVAVYQIALIGTTGQTLGKLAMRIKVVREADGLQPSFGTACMRWLIQFIAPVIAAAPFGFHVGGSTGASIALLLAPIIVYGPILWDRRRQGAHDKAAGTVVVDARYATAPRQGYVAAPPVQIP
jgi:uncharacterized RDD family membrane protein YckC